MGTKRGSIEHREKMRQIALDRHYGSWLFGKIRTQQSIEKGKLKMTGEKNPAWKGITAGYRALHYWINKHKIKTGNCKNCHTKTKTTWANISHLYKRMLNDWAELCLKCNINYDRGNIKFDERWLL